MYVVDCKVCHRWSSVPTIEIQTICRDAGACLECMKHDYFVLKVRIAAIEMHLDELAARGKQMPEGTGRNFLRNLYGKKSAQLAAARAELERLAGVPS
jgi:hypothetical protein